VLRPRSGFVSIVSSCSWNGSVGQLRSRTIELPASNCDGMYKRIHSVHRLYERHELRRNLIVELFENFNHGEGEHRE